MNTNALKLLFLKKVDVMIFYKVYISHLELEENTLFLGFPPLPILVHVTWDVCVGRCECHSAVFPSRR